jgi:hypothetical protein
MRANRNSAGSASKVFTVWSRMGMSKGFSNNAPTPALHAVNIKEKLHLKTATRDPVAGKS